MMQLPTLAGIENALERVRPYLAETPLLRSELLSRALAGDVWLKVDTMSPIASFKLRARIDRHSASPREIAIEAGDNFIHR